MAYKEYKKVIKHKRITNDSSFTFEMDLFLEKNPDIKILHCIVHRPYHVSIIYEVLVEVNNLITK